MGQLNTGRGLGDQGITKRRTAGRPFGNGSRRSCPADAPATRDPVSVTTAVGCREDETVCGRRRRPGNRDATRGSDFIEEKFCHR